MKNAAIGSFAAVFVIDIFLPFIKGLGIARLIFFPVQEDGHKGAKKSSQVRRKRKIRVGRVKEIQRLQGSVWFAECASSKTGVLEQQCCGRKEKGLRLFTLMMRCNCSQKYKTTEVTVQDIFCIDVLA